MKTLDLSSLLSLDLRPIADRAAPLAALWGLAALLIALRPSLRPAPPALIAGAAHLLRQPRLAAPPTLADDVYRYVWEGLVWAQGQNPFRAAPDALELIPLRDLPGSTWALVNHRGVSTVYPPLAQLLFWLLAPGAAPWSVPGGVPGGVYAWKALSALCDVGSAWLLARKHAPAGWCWALLPLPALESAGSGHLEGIGVFLLLSALALSARRPILAAWAAWAGAMVKLLPGLLIPALIPAERRRVWLPVIGIASVLALLALQAGADLGRGLDTYQRHWSYNGSVYPLLSAIWQQLGWADGGLRRLLQIAGAGLCAEAWWRYGRAEAGRDPGRVALRICAVFVLLSPTVHPWYVLWPLAVSLWTGRDMRAWGLLGALAPLSYVVLATLDPLTGQWQEPGWVAWALYAPFYGVLFAGRLASRSEEGAARG